MRTVQLKISQRNHTVRPESYIVTFTFLWNIVSVTYFQTVKLSGQYVRVQRPIWSASLSDYVRRPFDQY